MNERGKQASFVDRFLQGLGCAFRAVPMILGSGRMILLSLLPFAVCLLIYAAVFVTVIALSDNAADAIVQPGTALRNVLHVLLEIAFVVVFLVIAVFTYTVASMAIAAPLYEWLSAAAERRATGNVVEEPFSLRAMLGDIARGVGHGLVVLLIEMFVLVFGLLLVPVTTVLAVMASAVLLSLGFMDHPLERRRTPWRRKVEFVKKHVWELMGLGLPMLGALAIPVIGAACLPIGVVGGTLLYLQLTAEAPAEPG